MQRTEPSLSVSVQSHQPLLDVGISSSHFANWQHINVWKLIHCNSIAWDLQHKMTVLHSNVSLVTRHHFISLHIHSMWETICDAQAGLSTHSSNSKICVQILQKAPFWNFRPESPPPTPPNEKLQIWDDQSLLWNTPPQMKYFRFEMTKVYSGIPPPDEKLQIWDDQSLLWNTPPPQWKTSDLRWPKFTLEYPSHPQW